MAVEPSTSSPLAVLTFIVAPAILTNSSSVLTLATSNRFARAVDRARSLGAQLRALPPAAEVPRTELQHEEAAERRLLLRQLDVSEQRVLLVIRALTAFYSAVGSFALGTLGSLTGASLAMIGAETASRAALVVAGAAGICGVGGLVTGAALLVWESRLTFTILQAEAAFTRAEARRRLRPEGEDNAPAADI